MDLTSPLPENEPNGPTLDVNELIILNNYSEFVFSYLETNDIILENVCNLRRNRFIIKLFCNKKCPKVLSKICPKFTKKVFKIHLSENKLFEIFLSNIFGVNVYRSVG